MSRTCKDGLLVSSGAAMNGLGMQDGKRGDLEKPFTGCFGGGMINIFEMSAGMAGTKVLTDKAHRDGSPVRRNRHDAVKKPIDPDGIHIGDRPMANDAKKSSSSKKSGGTPIKMLIEQEMSKETEPKQKQHNIVARLMGLDDAMPVQQPGLTPQRNLQEGYARSKSAGALRGRKPEEDVCFDRPRSREIHSCSHEKEYKDVYEVRQQSLGTNCARDHAPLKERGNENQNKKRMAMVRQKFMEAKRLAIDEKLLQSKEFQDALEVLSSNKDLFLKFLEEPNSLFLKHIKELQTNPSVPQTKCIAILKPSKTFEPKSEKHVKKQQHPPFGRNEREIDKSHIVSTFSHPKAGNLSQTTRIVVLKPSPANISDLKDAITTPSPELQHHGNFYRSFKTGETMESRKKAEETTRQMQDSVTSHWGDESLLSSVLPNGYVGDESSFDKSEIEYIKEDVGNLSDTEITTPTSRNSWDYNNRTGSPCSLSSFSRKSYSPESSMICEAKKRLSERWALVASNNTIQQSMHVWSGSGTLGEMLAMPELKKEEGSNGMPPVSSNKSGGEEELRTPADCLSIGRTVDVNGEESSPRTLSRSKSVPVSSSSYENIGLNTEASSYQISKVLVPKVAGKSKGGKSFLKGKVSGFFFRNKKPAKQKTVPSPLVGSDGRFHTDISGSVSKNTSGLTEPVRNSNPEESPLVNFEEQSSKTSSPSSGNDCLRKGAISSKVAISIEKPRTPENLSKNQGILGTSENNSGNQDQPSPISVLDDPFKDDVHSSMSHSSEIVNVGHPQALSRSEPIESIARSLSWDDLHLETSSSNPLKLGKEDGEEQERFVFVQELLSSAGLGNERVNTVFNQWHSPESPLDPILLSKILDRKAEGAEARARRSSQRLLFDCVNVALLDIGHTALLNAYPWAMTRGESQRDVSAGSLVEAEVWGIVRVLFSDESQISPGTDNTSMVVDRLLRKYVAGRRWADLMQMELDEVCQEIGGKISEELVREVLLDFTGECL